jgi:hypothetical protein
MRRRIAAFLFCCAGAAIVSTGVTAALPPGSAVLAVLAPSTRNSASTSPVTFS